MEELENETLCIAVVEDARVVVFEEIELKSRVVENFLQFMKVAL